MLLLDFNLGLAHRILYLVHAHTDRPVLTSEIAVLL